MIEKNVNINKKHVKRILEADVDSKRVNILDSRFYSRNGNYYPSVTNILQFMPKNKYFENWLKDVGHNSDIIANKAAGEGTQVHNAVEAFLNGEEITWIDEYGNAKNAIVYEANFKPLLSYFKNFISRGNSCAGSIVHVN